MGSNMLLGILNNPVLPRHLLFEWRCYVQLSAWIYPVWWRKWTWQLIPRVTSNLFSIPGRGLLFYWEGPWPLLTHMPTMNKWICLGAWLLHQMASRAKSCVYRAVNRLATSKKRWRHFAGQVIRKLHSCVIN